MSKQTKITRRDFFVRMTLVGFMCASVVDFVDIVESDVIGAMAVLSVYYLGLFSTQYNYSA